MERNAFWDFCKAENSEDEEDNRDLQSRLYAEIYYGSSNVDTKSTIKSETPSIDNDEFRNSTKSNKTSDRDDSLAKSNSGTNQTKTCSTNDIMGTSLLTEEDDKSRVKSISVANEPGTLYKNNKNDSRIPRTENLQQSQTNVLSKGIKNDTDSYNVQNTSRDVLVKSEIEVVDIKEELTPVEDLDFERKTTASRLDRITPKEYSVDDNVEKIQASVCTEPKEEDSCDILKKYEFAKLFINKLYVEKYETLNKRLHELNEEKKANLKNKQEKIQIEENERKRRKRLDTSIGSMDETEEDTRYNVLTRSEKMRSTSNDSEEILILSDTESESAESILEVPIPPKPQPPVINLQDSDDCLDTSSSGSDMEQEYPFRLKKKASSTKESLQQSSRNKENAAIAHMTEDIMLNCTKVQKGALSIREIMETSKNARNKSEQCSSKDASACVNEIDNRDLNRTDKSFFVNDKSNKSNVQLPLETINNSNVVYERGKGKSVTFAENINFHNSSESSLSRKRHCEDDSGPSNVKQRKTVDDGSNRSETNSKQNKNRAKSKEETWEEYFFRPLSERLKAFYNNSQGQENFSVQEIQSKMSKDPRLWAILDEDLMPSFSRRQRFWNTKCNNCQQEGHLAHNCPQPRKPPQCHMCGSTGHTEIRCPDKMCLTCGKKQGTYRKTCESCRTLHCQMCNAVGHKSSECPDHWRRFHQTTHYSEINIPDNLSEVMKPADLLYCCNCTKRGHESTTCHEYRWSQHFPTPAFVTNYTDGLQSTSCTGTCTREEDMIPLYREEGSPKRLTAPTTSFSQEKDPEDNMNYRFLYTYGGYRANQNEIITEIVKKVPTQAALKLISNEVCTSLLDQLYKIVKFQVAIFRTPKIYKVRIRTEPGVCLAEHVYEFFQYWLQLEDEDKKLALDTNLPRNVKGILCFLTTRWEELEKNEYDPIQLYNQLNDLKILTENANDPTTCSASTRIFALRRTLLRVAHTRPKFSRLALRLQKLIARLQNTAKKIKGNVPPIKLTMFVDILVIYNKLFLPRAVKVNEYNRLLNLCKAEGKIKLKSDDKSRKQKKAKNPYEKFKNKLQTLNQQKKTSDFTDDDIAYSSTVTQKRGKQLPATSECSLTNTISSDDGINCSAEHDHTTNKRNTAEHSSPCNSMQVVQLQHNQNMRSEKPVENDVRTVDSSIDTLHFVPTPLRKVVCSDTLQIYVHNDRLNNVPCTEGRLDSNAEKQVETISKSSEMKASTSQQENGDMDSAQKGSKKGKKYRWSSEAPNQTPKEQQSNLNIILRNKASTVINEALSFDLPHMNKAVEEVRRRIRAQMVKQEHIDVLQRLITLEKDHRKYMTSFSSYLK